MRCFFLKKEELLPIKGFTRPAQSCDPYDTASLIEQFIAVLTFYSAFAAHNVFGTVVHDISFFRFMF